MDERSRLNYDLLDTPLGPLWMGATAAGLCILLWKETESDFLSEMRARFRLVPERNSRKRQPWRRQLTRYFAGEKVHFDAPGAFSVGTPFQEKIWRKMLEIPYGEVRSYQWIADQLNLGRAARAVGGACGSNPLPIVVPCHRVVHQDGSLGGYRGGLEIKKGLLAIEAMYENHSKKRENQWPMSMR